MPAGHSDNKVYLLYPSITVCGLIHGDKVIQKDLGGGSVHIASNRVHPVKNTVTSALYISIFRESERCSCVCLCVCFFFFF